MKRSDLYEPLAAMLSAKLKKSCPPVRFCCIGRQIQCVPAHHKGVDLTEIYRVNSHSCLYGLTSGQWDDLVNAVFEFMERSDLCLESLKP